MKDPIQNILWAFSGFAGISMSPNLEQVIFFPVIYNVDIDMIASPDDI